MMGAALRREEVGLLETPRELLERLRAQEPPPNLPTAVPEEEAIGFFTVVGFSIDEARSRVTELRRAGESLGQGMLDDAVRLAPSDLRQALTEDETKLCAGALYLWDLNAEALRAANEGWLLVINQGLMLFVYNVARVVASQLEPRDDGQPAVTEAEAYRELERVYESYLISGLPSGGDVALTRQQYAFANSLTIATEHFVLYHELGHHVAGDLDNSDVLHLAIGDVQVTAAPVSWDREYRADQFGLDSIVALGDGMVTVETMMAYAGAEFLFEIMDVLERARTLMMERGQIPSRPIDTSHPPAAGRLNSVRRLALTSCPDQATLQALASTALRVERTLNNIYKQSPSWRP